MNLIALAQQHQVAEPLRQKITADQLDPVMRALLNRLRMTFLQCRTAARSDIFEACAVLSHSKVEAFNASAEVLMKCLAQALGHSPVLFRPNVNEVSFDEAWLLRAVEMATQKNWDSFQFLLRSRVPAQTRRNLAFLIIRFSEQPVKF